MSAPAPPRTYGITTPRRIGRPPGSTGASRPVPAHHRDAIGAFHRRPDLPAGAHARKAAVTLVNALLCEWCNQSRVTDPPLCRCRP